MATKKKEVAGGKEYKGSAANGGRKIIVEHYKDSSGKWHTTSKNAAKAKYEKKHGKLPKGTDVDHKDNNHDVEQERSNKKGPSYGAFSIYFGKSENQLVTAISEDVPSYASGPKPHDPKFSPRLVM